MYNNSDQYRMIVNETDLIQKHRPDYEEDDNASLDAFVEIFSDVNFFTGGSHASTDFHTISGATQKGRDRDVRHPTKSKCHSGRVSGMKFKGSTAGVSKRVAVAVVAAWLCFGAGGPVWAAGMKNSVLTLGQALELAVRHNPGYHAALQGVAAARAELAAAKGTRFPRVDLFSGYWYDPYQPRRLIPGALLRDLPQDKIFQNQILSAGATAFFPLYTGGRIGADIRGSDFGLAAARHQAVQARQDLELQVTRTFYSALLLGRVVRAERRNVAQLVEAERVVSEFLRHGEAARLQRLRVLARLAAVHQALIRARNDRRNALAQLVRLIGMPETTSPRLGGPRVFEPVVLPPLNDSTLLAKARANRPVLQALKAALGRQHARVQAARAGERPQVGIQATYMAAKGLDNGSPLVDNQGVFTVTLSQLLFDGGVVRAGIDRARARMFELEDRLADLRLEVRRQVRTALDDLRAAAAGVRNSRPAVAQAQEALRVEVLKFKVGKGVVDSLLLAQAEALKAEVEYDSALVAYRLAYVGVQHTVGEDLIEAAANRSGTK